MSQIPISTTLLEEIRSKRKDETWKRCGPFHVVSDSRPTRSESSLDPRTLSNHWHHIQWWTTWRPTMKSANLNDLRLTVYCIHPRSTLKQGIRVWYAPRRWTSQIRSVVDSTIKFIRNRERLCYHKGYRSHQLNKHFEVSISVKFDIANEWLIESIRLEECWGTKHQRRNPCSPSIGTGWKMRIWVLAICSGTLSCFGYWRVPPETACVLSPHNTNISCTSIADR